MASLQGSVPNMTTPRNLLRSCSFGAPSPRQMPSQQPSYLSSVSPSLYMMQQVPSNMMQQVPSNMPHHVPSNMVPMVHQGIVGIGSEGAAFGSIGFDHHAAGRYSQPSTPNSFSPAGGNPFGQT